MAERLAASRLAAAQADTASAQVDDDRAPLPSRLLAYAIDSFALLIFVSLFAAVAGVNVLLRTDSGEEGITDADQWFFVFLIIAAIPAWLCANLLLALRRSQTLGQFVLGLRVVREDNGTPPGFRQLLAYWLVLHPLFFHPLFGGCWAMLALIAFAELTHELPVILALAGVVLCLAGPVAGLLFALIDPQRRAIHDRLAGLKVVRLD